MATPVDDREKRLAELKKEVTRRGFDRHASLLKDISELPIELQSSTVIALAFRETIQTVIAFPPQIQRGWHYVPKQALLFTAEGMIHLVASIWPDEEPQVTYLKECDLMYMKITLLLLYGLLEIVVQGQDSATRLQMEFNTVDWYCLSPPLRRFLQVTKTPRDKDLYSRDKQPAFEKLPLKFSNGVRIYGLLPGEELEELVFQAGDWQHWLYLFRRPTSADTLLLLSSHYMVMMQEDLHVKQGWILSYIPRESIAMIRSRPCGLWNELSVQMKRGNQPTDYRLMLKGEAAEAWHRVWVQHGCHWEDLPVPLA